MRRGRFGFDEVAGADELGMGARGAADRDGRLPGDAKSPLWAIADASCGKTAGAACWRPHAGDVEGIGAACAGCCAVPSLLLALAGLRLTGLAGWPTRIPKVVVRSAAGVSLPGLVLLLRRGRAEPTRA